LSPCIWGRANYFKPFEKEMNTNSEQMELALYIIIQAVRGILVGTNFYRPHYLAKPELVPLTTKMVMAALTNGNCGTRQNGG